MTVAALPEGRLADQLETAKAVVANLERQLKGATCAEAGHDWKSLGGKNAGCDDQCVCSVPVHECERCGDCDYGDNPEAAQIISKCAEGKE